MSTANGGPLKPDAVFITHSHGDHINGAGVLGRKTNAPLYMLRETFKRKEKIFNDCDVRLIKHGDKIAVGDFIVDVFDTRHDRPSVGFVVKETKTGKRFAYLTDTGAIGKGVRQAISECDSYLLEADYDEEELEKTAEYDDVLKDRIRSPWGHLGTQQILNYINEHIDLEKVSWILLGHLSTITNSPELVQARIDKSIATEYIDKFYLAPLDTELTL
jgi:phosphoribosyl 1,2-cyclic phosphodiesterase